MNRKPTLIALQFSFLAHRRHRHLPLTLRQRLPRYEHTTSKHGLLDHFVDQETSTLEWGPFCICFLWAKPKGHQ